ncbi:MAG: hypothetical protein CMJ83_16850 [Planctomycetes bacterium]|nr:hypothetical protein [Planctomycetota bacterium]
MRLLAAIVLVTGLVAAQPYYLDFSSVTDLSFNGNAGQNGNELRVNAAVISDRGSVWYDFPVALAGGFDFAFVFRINQLAAGGGDGMAFVIQNDPRLTTALGNHASQMGYGKFANAAPGTAIANSLAFEIDTYANGNMADPNGNHVSVHTDGPADNHANESLSIGVATPTANLSDGFAHTMRIRYVPGTLDVFIDDMETPLLSIAYDIVTGGSHLNGIPVAGLNLLGGGSALVGFTAGNGGAWENHDVLSWLSPPWEYQLNTPGSSLSINGTVDPGPTQPIAVTSAIGATATINLASTNAGLPWEMAVIAPGTPAGLSVLGIATPGLQTLNVNIASPAVFWFNGGSAPALGAPFAPVNLAIASPAAFQAGAQMLNLDATHPDSFRLSHPILWTVQ